MKPAQGVAHNRLKMSGCQIRRLLWRGWRGATAGAAAVLAALLMLPWQSAAAQVIQFDKAWQATDTGTGSFPMPAIKVEVPLPDEWHRSRPHNGSPAWYQLQITPEQWTAWPSGVPLSLFVARACGKLAVQLNGSTVLANGPQSAGVQARCGHPVLVPVPAPLWTAAQLNVIDIRLEGQPLASVASRDRAASLGTVAVGPTADLLPRYERERAKHTILPQFTTIALVQVGGLVMMLGWWHRGETHLVYFGLAALFWGLLSARHWWPLGTWPSYDTELLITSMVPLTTFATVQFFLFFAGWRSRPLEAALLVQCVMVPATMLAAGANRVHMTATFWYVVMVLEVAAAAAFYLYATRQTMRQELVPMAIGAASLLVMAAIEFAILRGFLSPDWRVLPQLVWPLMAIAMGLWLMYQHGQALLTAEDLKRALEVRLREATEAMERNYNQMAELRVEKVTQQERKRIAADLHDDLGAKLLTIVHTSDNDRISSLAREALEEMRLSVRGLTGKPVKLIDALGDWRAEVVSRLSQTGVEGDWQAPTDDLPQTLSARAYVQTTRILREAVNNIIKHSGASRCTIKCLLADGDFQLVIQDNGKGIPMELDGKLDRGHGMSSMKHRAKQMQGQCLVESGPGYGTLIRLTLPLDKQIAQGTS
jgi:two-component system, NarL family, sensor histidine kinase UhpB